MSPQEMSAMQAELAKLKAENEFLKKQAQAKLKLMVGKSGTVQIMGLRRFPVALFPDEIEKILAMADQIRAFVENNKSELKAKNDQAKLAKLQPVAAAA